MLNAYEVAWLPKDEKKALIDSFKDWAEMNSVHIGKHYFNKHGSSSNKQL